jgi:hypothetical protein
MPTPFWTRFVIGVAAVLWFGIAYLLDAPVDEEWLKPAGYVMSAVVLLLLAFDTLLWRWLPLAVTKRPNVRGTWKAKLHYEWPPVTPTQSKECYLLVRQTFSTVSVQMFFDISSSVSRSADIQTADGSYQLWWSYLSMANQFDRENPPHRGAAELTIATVPKIRLDGQYWTERKTVGRITTSARSKKLYDSWEAAQAGKYKPLP